MNRVIAWVTKFRDWVPTKGIFYRSAFSFIDFVDNLMLRMLCTRLPYRALLLFFFRTSGSDVEVSRWRGIVGWEDVRKTYINYLLHLIAAWVQNIFEPLLWRQRKTWQWGMNSGHRAVTFCRMGMIDDSVHWNRLCFQCPGYHGILPCSVLLKSNPSQLYVVNLSTATCD